MCIGCSQNKPAEEYHYKNKAKGVRQDRCISCAKEYAKKHYEANKDKRLEQINERQNQVRQDNRKLYADFITAGVCSVCAESDSRCLTSTIHNDDILYKSTLVLADLIKSATIRCLNCEAKNID
jgi:hypothetical protein